LLSHLLSFYSTCVLPAESQIGDGHIIKVYVEVLRSLRQDSSNVSANNLHEGHRSGRCAATWTLDLDLANRMHAGALLSKCQMYLSHCEKLTGIVLCDDALQRFLQQ